MAIDLPAKLRKEYDVFLILPLKDIYNTCLEQNVYPDLWKIENVTPIPKVSNPTELKELRKIACTSDYSKIFESILKDWILEDIERNIDPSQFGARKGTGTEHLVVSYVDRVLKLLDSKRGKAVVIAAAADWAAAFDRVDPTLAVKKIIKMGLRSSLVQILISYMTGRKMIVKFQANQSSPHSLI